MTTRRRSQAERDEATVEIGFALVSACFLGAVVFAAIVFLFQMPPVAGAAVAGAVALIRVAYVLWRHEERDR
ncbi:DUF6332 family protein [Streptomyces sp. NBC_01304]|uniref:DUF6332 family protein n=1 Tax=Streptomyces sp. NBC_01304 TaxID=2903818 RepID=UPI002E0E4F6E|nr:DUF6332 family protein [Streptomyces sp. NBC_01304]